MILNYQKHRLGIYLLILTLIMVFAAPMLLNADQPVKKKKLIAVIPWRRQKTGKNNINLR